ncbi:MAG: hypothetical protein QOH79_414 [Acidimicrobiaceae bacterium]
MNAYVAIVLALAALGRLAWFAAFVCLSLRRSDPDGKGATKRLISDARLPLALRGDQVGQDLRYDLFKTQQVTAFTIGGLSLTAWTFIATQDPPTHRFALVCLTATVLASIGATLLFRNGGGELTRMGYDSGLALAGLALVGALLSLALDVFPYAHMRLVTGIVLAVLLLRELGETVQQIRITKNDVFGATPPPV